MATEGKNLSKFDPAETPSAAPYRFGLVVSEWNAEITKPLSEGAFNTLVDLGADNANIELAHVPGSFELPLAAQWMITRGKCDAVIAIGSVVRGETPHFDFVCQAVAQGVKDVSLKLDVPVIFCVLTDDNIEQARARSGGKHGNKGVEAAVAAVKMASLGKVQ